MSNIITSKHYLIIFFEVQKFFHPSSILMFFVEEFLIRILHLTSPHVHHKKIYLNLPKHLYKRMYFSKCNDKFYIRNYSVYRIRHFINYSLQSCQLSMTIYNQLKQLAWGSYIRTGRVFFRCITVSINKLMIWIIIIIGWII